MADVFEDIRNMHVYFGIKVPETPQPLSPDIAAFRIGFLQEEMMELTKAYIHGDFPEQIDALIDILVVASGTLDMMGVYSELHWDEVLKCNMAKRPAHNESESKRKIAIDLIKPTGWVPPDHKSLLRSQAED